MDHSQVGQQHYNANKPLESGKLIGQGAPDYSGQGGLDWSSYTPGTYPAVFKYPGKHIFYNSGVSWTIYRVDSDLALVEILNSKNASDLDESGEDGDVQAALDSIRIALASLDANKSDITHDHDGEYEEADATILKEADVIDDLVSVETTKPLSANQGKVLDESKVGIVNSSLTGIQVLTQTAYDALDPVDENVLYFIKPPEAG